MVNFIHFKIELTRALIEPSAIMHALRGTDKLSGVGYSVQIILPLFWKRIYAKIRKKKERIAP